MISLETTRKLVDDYIDRYKDEAPQTKAIFDFLLKATNDNWFHRKNFEGHVTASAFVVNEDATKVLMIHHKSLDRWLQPGGHVDKTDTSLMLAALREVEEETGIAAATIVAVFEDVFDIDSHAIPENKKKQEAGHLHHDVRFLFTCKNDALIMHDVNEVVAADWVSIEEMGALPGFQRVANKIIEARTLLQ